MKIKLFYNNTRIIFFKIKLFAQKLFGCAGKLLTKIQIQNHERIKKLSDGKYMIDYTQNHVFDLAISTECCISIYTQLATQYIHDKCI